MDYCYIDYLFYHRFLFLFVAVAHSLAILNHYLRFSVTVFSPQERPVKGLQPQLRSGRHALLHHHRGEGASPVFILYISKYPPLRGVYSTICLSLLRCLFVPLVLKALKKTGLHPSDPRLKPCMDKFRQASRESVGEVMLDRELFHRYSGGGDGLVAMTCSWEINDISGLLHWKLSDWTPSCVLEL